MIPVRTFPRGPQGADGSVESRPCPPWPRGLGMGDFTLGPALPSRLISFPASSPTTAPPGRPEQRPVGSQPGTESTLYSLHVECVLPAGRSGRPAPQPRPQLPQHTAIAFAGHTGVTELHCPLPTPPLTSRPRGWSYSDSRCEAWEGPGLKPTQGSSGPQETPLRLGLDTSSDELWPAAFLEKITGASVVSRTGPQVPMP